MNWNKKLFSLAISIAAISILILFAYGFKKTDGKSSRVEVLPYYNDPFFTPHWLQPGSSEVADFHKIPPFSLINQEGETITEKSLEGKVYIADFFFTSCPGICPRMTDNMSILQEEFMKEDKVVLVSHSVTPSLDSVAVLKTYAEKKGIQSHKWYLLTGEQKQIYDLGRNFYFVEEDLGLEKKEDDFLHTENFVLIDKNRQIRGIYNGLNKTAISQLIADVKTLLKE